jgi:hypothetical protein
MIECINNVDGHCLIAQSLAGNLIRIKTVATNCAACVASINPKGINQSTCGLATIRLIEQNLFDRERFPELLNCQKVYGSIVNKPGTALARILFLAGVYQSAECGCESYARQMDDWGWAGCVERKNQIIDYLNEQKVAWLDMIKIALAGYLTTESLVNEALNQSQPCKSNERL